jgi:hypothetical protein
MYQKALQKAAQEEEQRRAGSIELREKLENTPRYLIETQEKSTPVEVRAARKYDLSISELQQ